MTERPTEVRQQTQRRSGTVALEDAQLVQRVQAGHTEAFTALVRKYQDHVFNTCWRICSSLEDARDVTQDAFLKAFENIGSFRGDSNFYTWLFRIAVNLAISQRRKRKLREAVSLDDDRAAGRQTESVARRLRGNEDVRADRAASDSELQAIVVAALQTLDEDHRAVIVLRDIEGLDYREIAEVLDIAIGTVKSRVHRARMALREAVAPLLGD